MTALLLLVPSAVIGWFCYNAALKGLGEMTSFRQRVLLSRMMEKSPNPGAFHTLSDILGNKAVYLSRFKPLNPYFNHLARLLQRADKAGVQPALLFTSQVLFALVGGSFFEALSGNGELSILGAMAGGILPFIWLRDQALKREKSLLRELPNALEIFSLCSEAGLSLEQGMEQYVHTSKPGPLRAEFSAILEQTQSGSSRKSALSAASDRLKLTDFTLFATSLIQAERFGTGVAKTLRQLSLTMRDKQSQRAEKAVQEMPVKMLFPLILFIMPVTFLIIFGPVLLQFFNP